MLRALGSASDLRVVMSHTRQGERVFMGIGFCVLRDYTRERGYDLLRALGSPSCDITRETGSTICYGRHRVLLLVISHSRQGVRFVTGIDWVLRLVISHTRQGIRFFTGIGFCVL